eukprot:Pgem_evm1s5392
MFKKVIQQTKFITCLNTLEHYGPKAYDIEIEYAYCPCAMGKYGKCSHVGGLLLWRKDPENYKVCTYIRSHFSITHDGNKEARAIPIK